MLHINLKNVEELIFQNRKVTQALPEFRSHFDQWRLSKMLPATRQMGKRAVLDLMNSIKTQHLELLSDLFGTTVTIDRLDYSTVKNFEASLEVAEQELNQEEWFPYFSTYRKGDRLYVSFWR